MPTPKAGYYLPNGERVPGTTTIIGRYKDGGALLHWAFEQGKSGRKTLYEERDRAADIGTLAHYMVEADINGTDAYAVLKDIEHDMAGKAANAFDQYRKWASQSRLTLLSKYQELQLVSLTHRFGGTPDAIAEIDGEIVLLDWKTSNGVYPDYLIQLAAYAHLLLHGIRVSTGEPVNIRTSGFHLLRFSKDFPDFEHRSWGSLDTAWRQFLLYREAYDNERELKRRAA